MRRFLSRKYASRLRVVCVARLASHRVKHVLFARVVSAIRPRRYGSKADSRLVELLPPGRVARPVVPSAIPSRVAVLVVRGAAGAVGRGAADGGEQFREYIGKGEFAHGETSADDGDVHLDHSP